MRYHLPLASFAVALALLACGFTITPSHCTADDQPAAEPAADQSAESSADKTVADPETAGPCVTTPGQQPIAATPGNPFSASNKPRPEKVDITKQPWLVESVGVPADSSIFQRPKMLWAKSYLWAEAPKVEVEEWITKKPDTEGKYILVEVWATWCPPCRRSLELMNYYHEKFGDELAIISICETDRKALEKMEGPTPLDKIKFPLAVDTKRRFADELGVFGIPHAVIIEPQYGCVIWEGMPTLPGHELSEDIIERILEIGRKQKAAEKEAAKTGGEAVTAG